MNKFVYLAGPINDQTYDEANVWRNYVTKRLEMYNIICISPLRCEPLREGETYKTHYECPKFGDPTAIASKNYLDVQSCDLLLAYFPTVSIGTVIEFGWATPMQKPIIVVSTLPAIVDHPIIEAKAGWILETLDDAIDVIIGLFEDYARW